MVPAVTALMSRYRKLNAGNFPTYIVMFRDGVGEGKLSKVFQGKVEGFTNTFKAN